MIKRLLVVLLAVVVGYLLMAPVPIDPVAWEPPDSPGYEGGHAVNSKLADLELLSIGDRHGPEDVAVARDGTVYAGTEDGAVLVWPPGARDFDRVIETAGRPLGLALDGQGRLLVADAFHGLLQVSESGEVRVLATEGEGVPFGFTNNVDVAPDGRIYFTDASSKFRVADVGAPYPTSLLDLIEHGGHGRLLEYSPASGEVAVLASGLQFANGVAVSHDGVSVLINETGRYRILRVSRVGAARGKVEVLIDNLPGFPDNLTRGREGRYWVGLVAPRNRLLDSLGPHPAVRRLVQRLPAFVRPKAEPYSHLLAIDDSGRVTHDFQDPAAGYPMVTAAAESEDYVYVASLTARGLARFPASRLRESLVETKPD